MTPSNPGKPAYCQWEIWQARWEHEDGTVKDRPVLILSSTTYAATNEEIWVAKFTKSKYENPFRIEFKKQDPSFSSTGLTDTCFLYISQARKISKGKMMRMRGRLPLLSSALIGVMMKQALKFPSP